MPLFYCDVQGCTTVAQRGAGPCDLCDRHLCDVHIEENHKCPRPPDYAAMMELDSKMLQGELSRLNARLDVSALQKRASDLRGGISCTLPPIERAKLLSGSINWHIPITFADGVVWLCRIPHTTARAAPQAIQDQTLLSEFATYRFSASIGIPVPAVYDVSISTPANPGVGASYLLMEQVAGKLFNWKEASPEERLRVLEQIADTYVTIKSHPFTSIGSLLPSDDRTTVFVGPFPDATHNELSEDGNFSSLGPFTSVLDYAKNVLQQRLDHIIRRESWHKFPVDAYLLHRFLLDNVESLPIVNGGTDGNFYLIHGESKGDHIVVDENYNIMGMIDWECSQTAAAPFAFAAPLFLIDWDAYVEGVSDPNPGITQFADILEAKGHPDLAQYARETRFTCDWIFVVIADELFFDEFYGTALVMLKLCGEECGKALDEVSWTEWKEKMLKRYADDAGLQSLLSAS